MITDNPELPRPDAAWTLDRLMVRLKDRFANRLGPDVWLVAETRLQRHFAHLFDGLRQLYGDQYDFFWHLEEIVATALSALAERSDPLRVRDVEAETEAAAGRPWFIGNDQVGAVAYVDRWAGTLADIEARIPYLRELGVTYLHLMPLLKARQGENDGGYAVSSYREVEPRLGTMADLTALADTLRGQGIRLCIDFVLNHTADDHDWALKARQAMPGIRAITGCMTTGRFRMPTSRTCARFSRNAGAKTSSGTRRSENMSGRPSTPFSGI